MDVSLFEYSLKLYDIIDELQFMEDNIGQRLPDASDIYQHYCDSSIVLAYGGFVTWTPTYPVADASLYVLVDSGIGFSNSDGSVGAWSVYRYGSTPQLHHNSHSGYGYGTRLLNYTFESPGSSHGAPLLEHRRIQPVVIPAPTLTPERSTLNQQVAQVAETWFDTNNRDVSGKSQTVTSVNRPVAIPDEATWYQDHDYTGLAVGQYEIVGYNTAYIWRDAGGRNGTYALTSGVTDNMPGGTIVQWLGWESIFLYYSRTYKGPLTIRHRRNQNMVSVYTTDITVYPWLPDSHTWAMYLADLNVTVLSIMGPGDGIGFRGNFPDTSFVLTPYIGENPTMYINADGTFNASSIVVSDETALILSPLYSYCYLMHQSGYEHSVGRHYDIAVLSSDGMDISYNYTMYPERVTTYADNRIHDIILEGLVAGIPIIPQLLSKLLKFQLPETSPGYYLLDLSSSPLTGQPLDIRVDKNLLARFESDVQLAYGVSDNMMLMVRGDLIGMSSNNRYIDLHTANLFEDMRAFTVGPIGEPAGMTLTVSWYGSPYTYTLQTTGPREARLFGDVTWHAYTMPRLPDISTNAQALYESNLDPGAGDAAETQNLYEAWYESGLAVDPMAAGVRVTTVSLNSWLRQQTNETYDEIHYPESGGGGGVQISVIANASETRYSLGGRLLYVTRANPATCKITRYYDSLVDLSMAAVFDHSANTRVNLVTRNYGKAHYSGVYFCNYGQIYDLRDTTLNTSNTPNTWSFPVPNSIGNLVAGTPYLTNPVQGAVLQGAVPLCLTPDATTFWRLSEHTTETFAFPDGYQGNFSCNIVLDGYRSGLSTNITDWKSISTNDISGYISVSGSLVFSDYPTADELNLWLDVALEYETYPVQTYLDSSLLNVEQALQAGYLDICGALAGSYITWQTLVERRLASYNDLLDPKYNLGETIRDYVGLSPSTASTYVFSLRNVSGASLSSQDVSLVVQACRQPNFFYRSDWATVGGTIENPTVTFNLTEEEHDEAIAHYNDFLTTVIQGRNVSLETICLGIDLSVPPGMNGSDFVTTYQLLQRLMNMNLVDPGYVIQGPMKFPYRSAIEAGYVSIVYVFSPPDRDRGYANRAYFSEDIFAGNWGYSIKDYIIEATTKMTTIAHRSLMGTLALLGVLSYNDVTDLADEGYYDFLLSSMISADITQHVYDGYHHILPLQLHVSPDYNVDIAFMITELPNNFNIVAQDGVALVAIPERDTNTFFVPVAADQIDSLSVSIPYDGSAGHTYNFGYCCYFAGTTDKILLKKITISIEIPVETQYQAVTNYYINQTNDLPGDLAAATQIPRMISAAGMGQIFMDTLAATDEANNTNKNRTSIVSSDILFDLKGPEAINRQTLINSLNRDVIYELYNDGSYYGYGYNPVGELTYSISGSLTNVIVTPVQSGHMLNIDGTEYKISSETRYLIGRTEMIALSSPTGVPLELAGGRVTGHSRLLLNAGPGYVFSTSRQPVSRLTETETYVLLADANDPVIMYPPTFVGSAVDTSARVLSVAYQPSLRDTTAAHTAIANEGVGAGALANIGGEFTVVSGNNTIRNAVTFSIRGSAGATVAVAFDYNRGMAVQTHLQAMITVMVSDTATLNTDGVGITASVYFRLKVGVETDGTVALSWDGDNIRLGAGGNVFAGVADAVNINGAYNLGPVGAGAGGGFAVGAFVSAGGSAAGTFDGGTLALNLDVNLGLLLGLKFNLDFDFDVASVVNSVEWVIHGPSLLLISNGMTTALALVDDGLMTTLDALENGVLSVPDILNHELMTIESLVSSGVLTGYEAIQSGYTTATAAALSGLITTEQAVVNFGVSGYFLYRFGATSVEYLLKHNILNYAEFADDAAELLFSGAISIQQYILCTEQNIENIANITTGLVRSGIIDISRAIEEVGIEIGNAIVDEINDVIDDIGDFFGL